jgi:MFS transporter, DHA1 family, inner membrane transport protein
VDPIGTGVPTGRVLQLLALGNFVIGMGAFVVIGIVTPLAESFAVDKSRAAMVLTVYAVSYALLSPIGAALTGTWPRRLVLSMALVLFGLGSLLSALAPSIGWLTASRVLVAMGGAIYTPMSAGVAVALAPPEQRGRALATVFGGITLAQVVGVPFGAWIAYRFGWQATFLSVAALAAVAAPLLFRLIPAAVSFQTTGLSAIGTALKDTRLAFAIAFTATIITAIYVVFTYFGPLIEASIGRNPELRTGFLVLYGMGAVVGNYLGGYMTDRIGPARTLAVVCLAQALVMPLFSIIPWSPLFFAIIVGVWSAFGWAFMAPQQSRLTQMAPRLQSLALALNAAMIYLGIAIGSALAAGVLGRFGLQGLGIAGGLVGLVALLHLWLSQRISAVSRPV